MARLAILIFALAAFGAAALAYTLTAHLEYQPEYSSVMTDGMRVIGSLIALFAALCGIVLVGYVLLASV